MTRKWLGRWFTVPRCVSPDLQNPCRLGSVAQVCDLTVADLRDLVSDKIEGED